jgi:uncharacterized protein YlxW (UPF0749 family)
MSSTSYTPRDTTSSEAISSGTVSSRSSSTWLWSLTGICFLFGALLALQMNSQTQRQRQREAAAQQPMAMQAALQNTTRRLNSERNARTALQIKLNAMQGKLAAAGASSMAAARQQAAQTRDLQLVAGLSAVSGPGVVMILKDNPDAAKEGGDTAFLPGIVHDYDLLQVVNELRLAGAEAIAVNGVRITGFTPIRCVGSPIYINGAPASAPFRVEAVGEPETMKSALSMPGGIVDKLSQILPIRVATAKNLSLPAAEAPKLKHAKAAS